MHRRFLAAIDAAVDRALPAGWPRLPRHWLPARGSVQARHAFRLAHDTGPRPYLVVVALPPFAARTPAVEGDLAALVDHVLGRGGTLLLLYEHESDPNGWVREHLDFPHPRFLCLPCVAPRAPGAPLDWCYAGTGNPTASVGTANDVADDVHGNDGTPGDDGSDGSDGGNAGEDYTVAPTWNRVEPLSGVIHDLWCGRLFYLGPCEGVQTVFVETMRSTCWRCHFSLDIVTGIVFPDCEVVDGSLPHWTYYQALLQLARIPDPIIPALSAAVEGWRAAGDRRLTVIRWRYSTTAQYAYWAAECTACGAFQGDFPVMEERMQWLEDLDSRRTGILSYRPLHLEVPRRALQELTWGMEVNPHARFLGWYRAGDPELERPPAAATPRAAAAAEGLDGESRADVRDGMDHADGADEMDRTGNWVTAGDRADPSLSATAPGFNAISAAAVGCVAISNRGPVRRLGEILVAWLGWMG